MEKVVLGGVGRKNTFKICFIKSPPINKNNAAKVDIYKRDNETFFVLAYTSHSDYTETLIFQSRTIVSGLGCWEIRDSTQIWHARLKVY